MDLTDQVIKDSLSPEESEELTSTCEIEQYNLTNESKSLLEKIENCPPSLACIRKILMNYEEFDGKQFDLFLHNDYDFIHGITLHWYGLSQKRSTFKFNTNAS